jgi:hypothetical protein
VVREVMTSFRTYTWRSEKSATFFIQEYLEVMLRFSSFTPGVASDRSKLRNRRGRRMSQIVKGRGKIGRLCNERRGNKNENRA